MDLPFLKWCVCMFFVDSDEPRVIARFFYPSDAKSYMESVAKKADWKLYYQHSPNDPIVEAKGF